MHSKDWLERWQKNHIGFHEPGVNRHLERYFAGFNLQPGDAVFMPLCGKANDIAWLARQGMQVTGIELSSIAIEAFFAEHKMQYQQFESDRFIMRKSGNICLLQGDFFALQPGDLSACDLVYDRASLIAIDELNQLRYCRHLLSILPSDSPVLLISLDYDQSIINGPPFAVSGDQLRRCYAASHDIELLCEQNVVDERPRWREQGLTQLIESVYRLNRRAVS